MTSLLDRASAAFEELCDLALEDRERRLAELRRQDPELARKVEELLQADQSPDERLERRAVDFLSGASGGSAASPETLAWIERLTRRRRTQEPYEIRGEIARGGMGTIFDVWDRDLERSLVMKRIAEDSDGAVSSALDPGRVQRFLNEARITGQLDHPGIVPVHELGIDELGRPYFTMKRVEGRTLSQIFELVHVGKEGWTLRRALGLFQRLCEALAFAHSRGVVHRDLKPANVMVGSFGEVYVMDWGIAKEVGKVERPGASAGTDSPVGTVPPTVEGRVLGTVYYMSPEQAAGRNADVGPHSDIYSLGAMLYEVFGKAPPYKGNSGTRTPSAVIEEIRKGPPPPLGKLAPGIPRELLCVCERAMAREWRARYPDVRSFSSDISAFLENRRGVAWRDGPIQASFKAIRRHPALFTLVSASAAILMVGVLGYSLKEQESQRADLNWRLKVEAEARTTAEQARATAEQDRALIANLTAQLLVADKKNQADELGLGAEEGGIPRVIRQVLADFRASGFALDGTEPVPVLLGRLSGVRSIAPATFEALVGRLEGLAIIADQPQLYCVMLFCEGRFPREVSARRRPLWEQLCGEFPDVLAFLPRLDALVDGLNEDPWKAAAWAEYRARRRDRGQYSAEILKVLPESAQDVALLAAFFAGDPDDAVRLRSAELFAVLTRGHEDYWAEFQLGYWKSGALPGLLDLPAAREHLYRAVTLEPGAYRAWSNLGVVLLKLEQDGEALHILERALAIQPEDPMALENMGEALRRAGKLDQALAFHDQSIKIRPDVSPTNYYNRGLVLVALDRCPEAEMDFRKAVEVDPGYAKAWGNLGCMLAGRGQKEEALQAFDKAIALEPTNPEWVKGREEAISGELPR